MLKPDPLIVETTARVCTDLCAPELVNAAEDGTWPAELWDALEGTGLSLAWVPEASGAETLGAGWLLGAAGLEAPAGPMTVAPVRAGEAIRCSADGVLRGSASGVPFAARAGHIVAIVSKGDAPMVALVPAADCVRASGASLAGEPQGAVDFDGVRCSATGSMQAADPPEALQRMGAALRSQQIAGALEHILELSLEYARERVQFGRPIARFQAIQHNLASLAGEVAAAGAAADAAASAIIRHGIDDDRTLFAVAAAKIRAGEAAGAGAAIAHQVHGAMGFTREYSLHQSTRRLWAWRDDFGAESVWAMRLGDMAVRTGAGALWPVLTSL
jgi:alkylation response protein AidB-like acyl-CoA dehydrogenase